MPRATCKHYLKWLRRSCLMGHLVGKRSLLLTSSGPKKRCWWEAASSRSWQVTQVIQQGMKSCIASGSMLKFLRSLLNLSWILVSGAVFWVVWWHKQSPKLSSSIFQSLLKLWLLCLFHRYNCFKQSLLMFMLHGKHTWNTLFIIPCVLSIRKLVWDMMDG